MTDLKNVNHIWKNKITAHRGKVHDYFGINLYFSGPGVLKISIIKYVWGGLDVLIGELGVTADKQATEYLFQVRREE